MILPLAEPRVTELLDRFGLSVNWIETTNADASGQVVFEVAESEVEPINTRICELMSGAAELSIPLLVEAGVGGNAFIVDAYVGAERVRGIVERVGEVLAG